MGGGQEQVPKAMLRFGGKTLLHRHLEILGRFGVKKVVAGVGYRADLIHAELTRLGFSNAVDTVYNAQYETGSIVTLWVLRDALACGDDILLMDADVLYDRRLMARLVNTRHANCFLLDRDLEPGEEPVKLCVRNGRPVEFRKHVDVRLQFDFRGESVGFFRLDHAMAARLAARAEAYISGNLHEKPHEEALRDLLLADRGSTFGFEDITGLPWMEIDFPRDIRRAEDEVLPLLQD